MLHLCNKSVMVQQVDDYTIYHVDQRLDLDIHIIFSNYVAPAAATDAVQWVTAYNISPLSRQID